MWRVCGASCVCVAWQVCLMIVNQHNTQHSYPQRTLLLASFEATNALLSCSKTGCVQSLSFRLRSHTSLSMTTLIRKFGTLLTAAVNLHSSGMLSLSYSHTLATHTHRYHFSHFKIVSPERVTCFETEPHVCSDNAASSSPPAAATQPDAKQEL